MANLRIISRLDVKAPYLIKGVHLEGLRKLGDPKEFAKRYYEHGIDEIIYIDAVASLYQRNTIVELIKHTAEDVFIPITAGGGVRSVDDARALLRAGADKVAINTAAINRPELINEIADAFGSQCMVLSVQAKQQSDGWEAYCDQGREHTGRNVIDWVLEGQERGAGEILLTSIDHEGARKGFNVQLTRQISDAVTIPVIASGGMGEFDHFHDVVINGHADAIAIAHVFHYGEMTIEELRAKARESGLNVRPAQ